VLGSPSLSPANQEIVQQVSDLARERFSARASHYDTESAFPVENYRDLHQAGLLALTVPQEYGGLGVDSVTFSLCVLEMAKGCPATALTFNMHANVIGTFLEGLATREQKQRYFAEVVEKGSLFASITSEPDSSFRDRFVLRTSFVPVDGGYHIQGTKHFCSLGDAADYYFVSGLMEGSTSAQDGLVSAMIPAVSRASRWKESGTPQACGAPPAIPFATMQ
jgi:alkylation response protein AidB-like acyl-CoA dehydrogenase